MCDQCVSLTIEKKSQIPLPLHTIMHQSIESPGGGGGGGAGTCGDTAQEKINK